MLIIYVNFALKSMNLEVVEEKGRSPSKDVLDATMEYKFKAAYNRIWTDEMMEQIEIIRSARRTVAIEIKADLRVIVRAPFGIKDDDIKRFVAEKRPWIEKHLQIAKARREEKVSPFTEKEIRALADAALKDIPQRVAKYASTIGVTVGRITIRSQKSRWGSCSAKGNLNFNCLLMLCPEEVRDYVVVHELCHRKEMNHSPAFWAQVERVLPEYKAQYRWLKENGDKIIRRL